MNLLNFALEHYRELALLKKTNPDLKLSIRLGGKSGRYTRYLKRSKTATQLVRSLIWYFYFLNPNTKIDFEQIIGICNHMDLMELI
jgi:hypothetical protein